MGFEKFVMDRNAGVSTVPVVSILARGGKTYELPKQARYQLRYTPKSFAAADAGTDGRRRLFKTIAQDRTVVK